MSLLLAYHDSKRCLVCSDDRAVSFTENGEVIAMPERVPKFITVAGLIFACLGTSDVCRKLNDGTRRMLADHPELSVVQLAQILPPGLTSTFVKRRQDPNRPIGFDNLEAAVLGYDAQAKRMRSFVFVATDKFHPVEVTANPNARIFALGHYNATDIALLERLTAKMQHADGKGLPWIAAQLRDVLAALHEKYPIAVGDPSFYAAIDSRGPVALPEEFPLPTVEEAATAAHLMTTVKNWVTTNKETAFNGTTRFFLGSITTPAAGQPDTIGNSDGGNSAQYGMLSSHFFPYATFQVIANGGNATKLNEPNITNANFSDSATFTVTGNSSAANVAQSSLNPTPLSIFRKPQSITAKVMYDVATNTLNGANGPSRFNIDITYIPAGGGAAVHNNVVVLTQGQTAAKQIASVSVPVGSTGLGVNITAQTLASDTTGQLIAHVYQFWADVIE